MQGSGGRKGRPRCAQPGPREGTSAEAGAGGVREGRGRVRVRARVRGGGRPGREAASTPFLLSRANWDPRGLRGIKRFKRRTIKEDERGRKEEDRVRDGAMVSDQI